MSQRQDTDGRRSGDRGRVPAVTDRTTWQAQIHELRVREKAHTRAGDVLAAERRRLPSSNSLLDRTVYGRQETWEDSPAGWPRRPAGESNPFRAEGRPILQWPRIEAGRSDDLEGGRRSG